MCRPLSTNLLRVYNYVLYMEAPLTKNAPLKKPTPPGKASRLEIGSWAMFDFANQAYTLLIITVVFSVIFPRFIVGDAPDFRLGNLLWSLSLAVSYFLVVLAAPLLGAIIDYTAAKKKFLFASYIFTVICTALLYLVEPGAIVLGILLIILSNFGYAVGESFIASFLPDLGEPKDLGKISGFGWAVGYIGGMISTAAVLLFIGEISFENFERLRWVGPLAAGFFLVGAIPTFLFLKERGQKRSRPAHVNYISLGFLRLGQTVKHIAEFKDLAVFLTALFFATAGLSIIISFTFIYGDQVIGWSTQIQTIMFITTQITAALGALLFGHIQDKVGARNTFCFTLLIWITAIFFIYWTPQLTLHINKAFSTTWEAQHVFLIVGCLAGLGLGATQSAGRALVGIFTPKGRSAEFFGFWGLSSKLAAIFGILGLGLLQTQFGLQNSILICALFFSLAFIVATLVNEKRGIKAAQNHMDSNFEK